MIEKRAGYCIIKSNSDSFEKGRPVMKDLFNTKKLGIVLLSALMLTGCASNSNTDDTLDSAVIDIIDEDVPLSGRAGKVGALVPTASNKSIKQNDYALLDYSNSSQGYVMVKYLKAADKKIKVQISLSNGTVYTYNLNSRSEYEVFPLTQGNGTYKIQVFENISGTKYIQVFSESVDVTLADEFLPFLYPNQYVNFSASSEAVKLSNTMNQQAITDLDVIKNVFDYVTENISYDYEKAKTVQSGYLPNVDNVLKEKTGICFDYAALMTAMLRSQGIPTKLVIGYNKDVYHAWISSYTKDNGWIDNVISFDGQQWTMMDPTTASTIGKTKPIDPNNYQGKYTY